MAMLSQDTTQIKMEVEKTKVVALVVSGQGGAQCYHTKVGQYYSTKENLMARSAVSVSEYFVGV